MLFSKQQREVLCKVSKTIWNSESRWQKLFEAGELDEVETEEVDEAITQIMVNGSKKSRWGTIMNAATAKARGKWGKDVPETTKVRKVVTRRRPTFEELLESLTDVARHTLYQYLDNTNLIQALAVDVASGARVSVSLVKKEDEQYNKDLEDLLSRLPEDLQVRVKTLNSGTPVDALEFVSELLSVETNPDQANRTYSDSLDAARAKHTRSFRLAYAKARFAV